MKISYIGVLRSRPRSRPAGQAFIDPSKTPLQVNCFASHVEHRATGQATSKARFAEPPELALRARQHVIKALRTTLLQALVVGSVQDAPPSVVVWAADSRSRRAGGIHATVGKCGSWRHKGARWQRGSQWSIARNLNQAVLSRQWHALPSALAITEPILQVRLGAFGCPTEARSAFTLLQRPMGRLDQRD